MLLNLIELRATDWGRAASSSTTEVSQPSYAAPASSNHHHHGGMSGGGSGGGGGSHHQGRGIFYGPDGHNRQALTAEERNFLTQNGIHEDEDEFE